MSNKCNPSAQFGFGACISSRMTTVIHVAVSSDSSDHQINYNCDNEPFALSPCQSLHGDMQPKPKTQNPGPRTQNPKPRTHNPKPRTQKKPWGDGEVPAEVRGGRSDEGFGPRRRGQSSTTWQPRSPNPPPKPKATLKPRAHGPTCTPRASKESLKPKGWTRKTQGEARRKIKPNHAKHSALKRGPGPR